jgi:hypothetical protein
MAVTDSGVQSEVQPQDDGLWLVTSLFLQNHHYQQDIFVVYVILHGQKKAWKEGKITYQMEKA